MRPPKRDDLEGGRDLPDGFDVPRRNDEVAVCPKVEDGHGTGLKLLRHVYLQHLANAACEDGWGHPGQSLMNERT